MLRAEFLTETWKQKITHSNFSYFSNVGLYIHGISRIRKPWVRGTSHCVKCDPIASRENIITDIFLNMAQYILRIKFAYTDLRDIFTLNSESNINNNIIS